MSPVRDWLAGYTPDWRTRARTGQLAPPPEDELGLLGGRAETLEHTFMEGVRRDQFRSETPEGWSAEEKAAWKAIGRDPDAELGQPTGPRDWLAGYTPDWREREAAKPEEDPSLYRGLRRAESIGPALPGMIPAEEAARMDEPSNIPDWYTEGSKHPILRGIASAAGDVYGTTAAGTVKAVARALPGDYAEKMASPEPSLTKRIGGVAEQIYGGIDQRRAERFPTSAIVPEVAFDRPKGMLTAEVASGFVAEGSKYIGGGMGVRAGVTKLAGAVAGTRAGQAAIGLLRGRKPVEKAIEVGQAIANTKLGGFLKEPVKDVLAFLPVDYVTTQREIDSVAYMADMFLDPKLREEIEQNPDGVFERLLATKPVAGGIDLLHAAASEAVKTTAGRTAFEAAFGFAADLGLRGLVGKPAKAAWEAATTPGAVGRATEAGVEGFARELAGPEFVPTERAPRPPRNTGTPQTPIQVANQYGPSDMPGRGITGNMVMPAEIDEHAIAAIMTAGSRREAYNAGGLWGDETFEQLLDLPHVQSQSRAEAGRLADMLGAEGYQQGVVRVFVPDDPNVLGLSELTTRNDVIRVTADEYAGSSHWDIGDSNEEVPSLATRRERSADPDMKSPRGWGLRGRIQYVRQDDVLLHGNWPAERFPEHWDPNDLVVNKLRLYPSEEAALQGRVATVRTTPLDVEEAALAAAPAPRYSRLEEVIKTSPKKATGEVWANLLKARQSKGAFKKTELTSSRLLELLDADPEKVFTRQEVLGQFEANRLETPTIIRGQKKLDVSVHEEVALTDTPDRALGETWYVVKDKDGRVLDRYASKEEADAKAAKVQGTYRGTSDRPATQWGGHGRKEQGRNETRPPENYQEVLITYDTPTLRAQREAGTPESLRENLSEAQDAVDLLLDEREGLIERMSATTRAHQDIEGEIPKRVYGDDWSRSETLDNELSTEIARRDELQESINRRGNERLGSQRGQMDHGDPPGTVERLRTRDRYALDPKTGKEMKLLSLDEDQSDVHKQARGRHGIGYEQQLDPELPIKPAKTDPMSLPDNTVVMPPKKRHPLFEILPKFVKHQEAVPDPLDPLGSVDVDRWTQDYRQDLEPPMPLGRHADLGVESQLENLPPEQVQQYNKFLRNVTEAELPDGAVIVDNRAAGAQSRAEIEGINHEIAVGLPHAVRQIASDPAFVQAVETFIANRQAQRTVDMQQYGLLDPARVGHSAIEGDNLYGISEVPIKGRRGMTRDFLGSATTLRTLVAAAQRGELTAGNWAALEKLPAHMQEPDALVSDGLYKFFRMVDSKYWGVDKETDKILMSAWRSIRKIEETQRNLLMTRNIIKEESRLAGNSPWVVKIPRYVEEGRAQGDYGKQKAKRTLAPGIASGGENVPQYFDLLDMPDSHLPARGTPGRRRRVDNSLGSSAMSEQINNSRRFDNPKLSAAENKLNAVKFQKMFMKRGMFMTTGDPYLQVSHPRGITPPDLEAVGPVRAANLPYLQKVVDERELPHFQRVGSDGRVGAARIDNELTSQMEAHGKRNYDRTRGFDYVGFTGDTREAAIARMFRETLDHPEYTWRVAVPIDLDDAIPTTKRGPDEPWQPGAGRLGRTPGSGKSNVDILKKAGLRIAPRNPRAVNSDPVVAELARSVGLPGMDAVALAKQFGPQETHIGGGGFPVIRTMEGVGHSRQEAVGKTLAALSGLPDRMQSMVIPDARKPSQYYGGEYGRRTGTWLWDDDEKRIFVRGKDPDLLKRIAQEKVVGQGGVPWHVPFRMMGEQQEAALKQLIDMAVEGGYDGVSIIPGKQSADLYSLRKVARDLIYEDGKLTVLDHQGNRVHREDHSPEELPSVVGSELAARLIASEQSAKVSDNWSEFPGPKTVEFGGKEYDLTLRHDVDVPGDQPRPELPGRVALVDAHNAVRSDLADELDDLQVRSDPDGEIAVQIDELKDFTRARKAEIESQEMLLRQAEAFAEGRGFVTGPDIEIGGQTHITRYDDSWPLTISRYGKEVGGIAHERIDLGFPLAKTPTRDVAVIDESLGHLETPGGDAVDNFIYYEDPVIERFGTMGEALAFIEAQGDRAVELQAKKVQFRDITTPAGHKPDPLKGDLLIRITPDMRRIATTKGQRISLRGPAGGAAGFAVGYALPAESPEERMRHALTGFQVGALGEIGATLGKRSLKLKGMPSELRAGIRDVDNALAAKNPTKDLNEVARARLGLKQQDLAHFGVDPNDTKGYSAFLRNQLQSTEAPRTPDIRGSYVRPEWMNASREKLKKLVMAGAGRGDRARFWYEDGQKALVTLVPNEEFDQFVKFFATFSQNTDPRQNFFEALREWGKVQRGEPISGVLAGKKKKAKRVLAGKELDTPKIWSFAENLLGSGDHATIDLWIWRILDDTTPKKGAPAPGDKDGLRYAQAREELREIAAELTAETGDEWTPAQVQASMWVEYRDKWSVETGGQPLGNDSFLELMDETLRRVEALDPTTRVVSEMMPSPQAGRVVGIQEADVATRVAYSEERLGAARKYLTKLFRDLDIADEVGGALGVEGALARGVRTRIKEGKTVSIGGTWEGRWNSNLPFVLPKGIEPWKRDVVVAALGNIFEQDAVFHSTLRSNDIAALKAAENTVDATGLNGSNSGVQVVTRQHMDQATSDALARHLGETLEGVNFTQQGDALLFGDFSGGTPQQFWDQVVDALDSFEGGRFWDEIADADDIGYSRHDGDLVGDKYGTGQQWDDLYNTARQAASSGDPVLGRLAPDLLQSHRDGLRPAYAKIDRKFKRRLAAKDKVNVEAQDPRPSGPSAPERLAGPDPTDPRLGAADPQIVSAIAKAGTGSLVGGFIDAQIGEDSPIEGLLIGAGVAVGPSIARVVKATRAATEVSDVAIDRALQQQVAAEVAGTAIDIPGAPLPKDVPPPRGPGADKIDPDEFVNIEKFGLDPKSTEKRLREEVQNVVDTHGMDPKVVVSHKQTIAMANSLGLDAEDIGKRLSGAAGAPAGAEMLAARNLISSNAKRMEALYKQLSDNGIHLQSEEAQPYIAQINALSAENHTLLAQYLPASSETGRALNAMKIAAQQTMDPATWTIRAAKVSGVTELPASVQAEIVRLTSAEDRAGLMKLLADLHQSDISEQVVALGKAAMLSAVPTHMMNLLSTAYNVFAIEHIKDLPASWIDHLISGWAGTDATKHWGSVGAQLEAAKKGAEQGIEGAKNVFSGRMLEGSLERWDQIRQTNIDLAQRTPILKHVPVLPQALDLAMDKFQKFVFGALGAGDASLTGFAVQRSLAEQARVIAKNEGLKGAALDARAADILANETTPEMMLESIAQGELATFRNRGIVGQGVVGLKRGIRETAKKTGGLVGAGNPAHTMTYLATEKIIPWSMTPSNVMTRVAEASPLGAASVAFDSYFWKLVTRQVDKSTQIPAAQKRIVETLGRSTVGSAPILLGMYLYNQGLLSLGWTREKAGQRELTGEEENAWKIGDTWISMERMSPGGNLVILGGYIAAEMQDPEATTEGLTRAAEVATVSGMSIARTAYEQSFLEGIRDLGDAVMATERRTGRENLLTGTASMFVPNILKRINRWVDPVARQRETVMDQLRQAIPGASRGLPARVDAFGQTVRRTPGFYASMVDPFQMSPDKTLESPTRKLMGDLDVNISRLRKLDDETNAAYQRRQREWGGVTERVIAGIINSGQLEAIERQGRQQNAHLEPEDQDLAIMLIQKEVVERAISGARSGLSQARRDRIQAEQRGRLTGAPTG